MSNVKQYRKKPIVIEAVIWLGRKSWPDVVKLVKSKRQMEYFGLYTGDKAQELAINTLEGRMTVGVGDYIIKGIKGEFYPCKPDIFAATYEEVTQQPTEKDEV